MDCYKCQFRGVVPGSAHSRCMFPGTKNDLFDFFEPQNYVMMLVLRINIDQHGVKNGWALWPVNFDPRWITNCWGFVDKNNPEESHKRFSRMLEVYEKGAGRVDASIGNTLKNIVESLRKVVDLTAKGLMKGAAINE